MTDRGGGSPARPSQARTNRLRLAPAPSPRHWPRPAPTRPANHDAGGLEPPAAAAGQPRLGSTRWPVLQALRRPSRARSRGHPVCDAALRVWCPSGSPTHCMPSTTVPTRARWSACPLWRRRPRPPCRKRGACAGPPPAANAPRQIVLSARGSSPVWEDSAPPPRRHVGPVPGWRVWAGALPPAAGGAAAAGGPSLDGGGDALRPPPGARVRGC